MCQIDDVGAWARAHRVPERTTVREPDRGTDDAEVVETVVDDLPAFIPPMPPHRPRRQLPWDGR